MIGEGSVPVSRKRSSGSVIVPGVIIAAMLVLVACGLASGNGYLCAGAVFWGALVLILYLIRPASALMEQPLHPIMGGDRACILIVMAVEIALSVVPMGWNPIWNGEVPDHRDQYELIVESFMDGRLDFEYDDIDPVLEEMDNPYDPAARDALGVGFHWDHAYYKGKYYMYFGVVPALLLFLPFRLLTGTSLTTYHATQVFVAFIIMGFYHLFAVLARRYFRNMPLGVYLALAFSMSLMSIWYSVVAPALYCTAITAGICLMVWSLVFYVKAFLVEDRYRLQLLYALLGAACGALVFGCRPPIGLGNAVAVFLLVGYLRRSSLDRRRVAGLLIAGALPYLIVIVCLMAYNHARFGSVTEFGQTYQLTNTDQHLYGSYGSGKGLAEYGKDLLAVLFGVNGLDGRFPYLRYSGVFVNFPLLLVVLTLLSGRMRERLGTRSGLGLLALGLAMVPLATIVLDLSWSPRYLERYNLDIYYLLGILCFIALGLWCESVPRGNRRKLGFAIGVASIAVCLTCVAFFLSPVDANLTVMFPEVLDKVRHTLLLGFPL